MTTETQTEQRPTSRVDEGGAYWLTLPGWSDTKAEPHAFLVQPASGDVIVSTTSSPMSLSFCLTAASAHALAEALHAVANEAESKPSTDDPASSDRIHSILDEQERDALREQERRMENDRGV
jgi:hypothetical protein